MPRFDDAALVRLRERLARRHPMEIDAPQYRRAAVLIPFIRNEAGGWSILLTRRSEQLAAHSGQVAFPGGGVEEGEALQAAALRESREEVGIPTEQVAIIGRLDDVVTNSGFLVAPFVGIIHVRSDYVMQEGEVVEVFEVPIEALLDLRNPEVRYVTWRDRRYPVYFYHYETYEIWGLTGRMLKALLDRLWLAV
ncbi:MAG: putative hydrolase [Acidobacteria bacterium]|nr:putative hydrolase [Acidobacteriota bacterium]